MLTILTPMVGKELYITNSHCSYPKILSEIKGRTLFEYSQLYQRSMIETVKKLYLRPLSVETKFRIDSVIKQVVGDDAIIIDGNDYTSGALCTCLLAADYWCQDDELLIASADQYIDINTQEIVDNFREANADIGVLTFSSQHPRWSYIRRDSNNAIIEVNEKKVISNEAIASFFYFKKTSLFFNAAKNAIIKSNAVGGNFYLSTCVNEIILLGANVVGRTIDKNDYYNFYDCSEINRFAIHQ